MRCVTPSGASAAVSSNDLVWSLTRRFASLTTAALWLLASAILPPLISNRSPSIEVFSDYLSSPETLPADADPGLATDVPAMTATVARHAHTDMMMILLMSAPFGEAI